MSISIVNYHDPQLDQLNIGNGRKSVCSHDVGTLGHLRRLLVFEGYFPFSGEHRNVNIKAGRLWQWSSVRCVISPCCCFGILLISNQLPSPYKHEYLPQRNLAPMLPVPGGPKPVLQEGLRGTSEWREGVQHCPDVASVLHNTRSFPKPIHMDPPTHQHRFMRVVNHTPITQPTEPCACDAARGVLHCGL